MKRYTVLIVTGIIYESTIMKLMQEKISTFKAAHKKDTI